MNHGKSDKYRRGAFGVCASLWRLRKVLCPKPLGRWCWPPNTPPPIIAHVSQSSATDPHERHVYGVCRQISAQTRHHPQFLPELRVILRFAPEWPRGQTNNVTRQSWRGKPGGRRGKKTSPSDCGHPCVCFLDLSSPRGVAISSSSRCHGDATGRVHINHSDGRSWGLGVDGQGEMTQIRQESAFLTPPTFPGALPSTRV
ncbi:hypothetical protein VTI74DRAFT_6849 [Chaetomium olivicolor]